MKGLSDLVKKSIFYYSSRRKYDEKIPCSSNDFYNFDQ